MNTENNVAGIEWFLTQVAPQLHDKLNHIQILIAGSNPVERISKLCEALPFVTLIANPESAAEIYRSGRVLINPMAVGGGVSIKAIDMLAVGRPIVTLPNGVCGLPEQARELFYIAEDPDSFASQIVDCLNQPSASSFDYALLDSLFGMEAVKYFLEDLRKNVLQSA